MTRIFLQKKSARGAAIFLAIIAVSGVSLANLASIDMARADVAPAASSQEDVALSLATLLRSARAVISENQKHINDASKGDKGLSGVAVAAKAKEKFQKASGEDLDSINSASLRGELLGSMMNGIIKVMDDAQVQINEPGVGFKGFLPAVFARLVTEEFRRTKGDVADIKLTAPKNYVRNRANRPDAWEHQVIESQFKASTHVTGQHVAELADKKGKTAYRLILPEYYNDSCLSCHGGPAGEKDITGGTKEGGVLGELGGAISVAIYE
jgi:hypothetical protein